MIPNAEKSLELSRSYPEAIKANDPALISHVLVLCIPLLLDKSRYHFD